MSATTYTRVEDISSDPAAWLKEWRFADSPSTSGDGPRKQSSVWINHDTFGNPCFSIEHAFSFFGLRDALDGSPNRSIEVDCDSNLTAFITAVQDHIKATALERSELWFSSRKTPAEIDAMFSPAISDSERYSPRLKLKVTPRTKLDRVVQCHDDRLLYTNAQAEHLTPKSNISVSVRLSKVWLMNRSFGVVFALDRCLIHPPEKPTQPSFYLGPPPAKN